MKASELKIDLTKERKDFAIMTALYVGNKAAQIDPTEWNCTCDYDSFPIIQACTTFADTYDFDMESDNPDDDEWFIDTELAREAAYTFADEIIKGLII